jgi:hypothetical protein
VPIGAGGGHPLDDLPERARDALDGLVEGLTAPAYRARPVGGRLRRSALSRLAMIGVAGTLLSASAFASPPTRLTAFRAPPAEPAAAPRMAASVVTGWPLDRALHLDFRTAMDRATVESNLLVQPAAKVRLEWSADRHSLTVIPAEGWRPGVFYTLTLARAAQDRDGQALAEPAMAIFYTRTQPTAELGLRGLSGRRLLPNGGLELRFSRPVALSSVKEALTISPRAKGRLRARQTDAEGLSKLFVWKPSSPLRPDTRYEFSLAATVVDRTGINLRRPVVVRVSTVRRPGVVRHEPASGAKKVDVDGAIRLRFDRPMVRAATQQALRVSGIEAGKGIFRWSDNDTLLTFDPAGAMRYEHKYTVTLSGAALSREGYTLAGKVGRTALSFSFTTEPKPVPGPPGVDTGIPPPSAGGGSVGARWSGVENYVLGLINCVRTGGLILDGGKCDGYGTGRHNPYLAPVSLHSGISTSVARPYAKFLADRGACSHYMDGGPGDRLRRAGYTSFRWAENLGCRSGDPYSAVLGSHLYFQSERPYNGGHWVNLRSPGYTTVGIGVWVTNGNVRVVTDFYDP